MSRKTTFELLLETCKIDKERVDCGGKLHDPCKKQREIMDELKTNCPLHAADLLIEQLIIPEEAAYEFCQTQEGKDRIFIHARKDWSDTKLFGMGSDVSCPNLVNKIERHLLKYRDEYGEEDQGTGIRQQDDSYFNFKNKKMRRRSGKCYRPSCNERERRRNWMYDLKSPQEIKRNEHPLLKNLPPRQQDAMFDKMFKELDEHNIRRKQYFLNNAAANMSHSAIRRKILEALIDRGYDVEDDNLTEKLIEIHGFPTDGTLSTFVVGMTLYADYDFELSPATEELDFKKLAQAVGLEGDGEGKVCKEGNCSIGPLNGEISDKLRSLDPNGNPYENASLFRQYSINRTIHKIQSISDTPWKAWMDIREEYENHFNERVTGTMTSFTSNIEMDSVGLVGNIYRIVMGDFLIVGRKVVKVGFKLQVICINDYDNPVDVAVQHSSDARFRSVHVGGRMSPA